VAVELNHTIVAAREAEAAARWFAEVFGLAPPSSFAHFWQVRTANGVDLDFDDRDDIAPQHYAFLVADDEFDAIFGRVKDRGVAYWADPGRTQPSAINRHDGGRGVYFANPDGHLLEIITVPYGGA